MTCSAWRSRYSRNQIEDFELAFCLWWELFIPKNTQIKLDKVSGVSENQSAVEECKKNKKCATEEHEKKNRTHFWKLILEVELELKHITKWHRCQCCRQKWECACVVQTKEVRKFAKSEEFVGVAQAREQRSS